MLEYYTILISCYSKISGTKIVFENMWGIIIALRFWLILFLKWVQKNYLDPLLDLFMGCTTRDGSRRERKYRLQYKWSAQRVRIWARGAYSPASIHSPANFLYTHLNYCHPNEVLKSDNITLQVRKICFYCPLQNKIRFFIFL